MTPIFSLTSVQHCPASGSSFYFYFCDVSSSIASFSACMKVEEEETPILRCRPFLRTGDALFTRVSSGNLRVRLHIVLSDSVLPLLHRRASFLPTSTYSLFLLSLRGCYFPQSGVLLEGILVLFPLSDTSDHPPSFPIPIGRDSPTLQKEFIYFLSPSSTLRALYQFQ